MSIFNIMNKVAEKHRYRVRLDSISVRMTLEPMSAGSKSVPAEFTIKSGMEMLQLYGQFAKTVEAAIDEAREDAGVASVPVPATAETTDEGEATPGTSEMDGYRDAALKNGWPVASVEFFYGKPVFQKYFKAMADNPVQSLFPDEDPGFISTKAIINKVNSRSKE